MAQTAQITPLDIDLKEINLIKHNGQDKINLLPQMFELTLHQSIFKEYIHARLVVSDTIGLHVNYPLLGEEKIEVVYKHTRPHATTGDEVVTNNKDAKLTFMIDSVNKILPDDKARGLMYVLELYSYEMLLNSKKRVQRAFKESYESMAKKILKEELEVNDPTRVIDIQFEKAKGEQYVFIPNLKPFEAITWLASRAVPEDTNHYNFLFFENMVDGYSFITIQKLIEDRRVSAWKYIYCSDLTQTQRNHVLEQLKMTDHNVIAAMTLNKRYSTIQKILAGYYENEYIEIDLIAKKLRSTQKELKLEEPKTIEKHPFNTDQFIKSLQNQSSKTDTKTRVRYRTTQQMGDQMGQDNYQRDKFGEAAKIQTALSQVSISISVPGDTRIKPGDMVEIELPEMHGFNKVDRDEYIAGHYLVTEVKHIIQPGPRHVTVLNINRDSFNKTIEPTMKYKSTS